MPGTLPSPSKVSFHRNSIKTYKSTICQGDALLFVRPDAASVAAVAPLKDGTSLKDPPKRLDSFKSTNNNNCGEGFQRNYNLQLLISWRTLIAFACMQRMEARTSLSRTVTWEAHPSSPSTKPIFSVRRTRMISLCFCISFKKQILG